MEDLPTFAQRMREAREAIGISQKQLGIQAGIDPSGASARINQYERGKHFPDQLTAQRLATVLNVPVSFLYEPDDQLAGLIRQLGRLMPVERQRLSDALKQ